MLHVYAEATPLVFSTIKRASPSGFKYKCNHILHSVSSTIPSMSSCVCATRCPSAMVRCAHLARRHMLTLFSALAFKCIWSVIESTMTRVAVLPVLSDMPSSITDIGQGWIEQTNNHYRISPLCYCLRSHPWVADTVSFKSLRSCCYECPCQGTPSCHL